MVDFYIDFSTSTTAFRVNATHIFIVLLHIVVIITFKLNAPLHFSITNKKMIYYLK